MTESRFVMVSEWMSKGNINEFLVKEADVDRLGLVRLFRCIINFSLMTTQSL